MKKTIIILIAVFLCAVILSGCSWLTSAKKGYESAKEGVEGLEIPTLDTGIKLTTEKVEHICEKDLSCIESALVDETGCPTSCRVDAGIPKARLKSDYTAFCLVNCEDSPCYYCCTEISCKRDECGTGERPLSEVKVGEVACLEFI